jgi:hypothetical protein
MAKQGEAGSRRGRDAEVLPLSRDVRRTAYFEMMRKRTKGEQHAGDVSIEQRACHRSHDLPRVT